MSLYSIIRDIFIGIKKDRIETKKADLEVGKLQRESSLIKKTDLEDVMKYDPKVKELDASVQRAARGAPTSADGPSSPIGTWLAILSLLILAGLLYLFFSG